VNRWSDRADLPHIGSKSHGRTALGFRHGEAVPMVKSRAENSNIGWRPSVVNQPKWTSDAPPYPECSLTAAGWRSTLTRRVKRSRGK
jgi:hypothetical protein